MIKSVIKEIIIMLLLCIAILLILGILFYDYIPTNKVVPIIEAYSTPKDVKEEIEEEITELDKVEISYEITDSNLDLYKESSSYKPGKSNPFALQSESANTEVDGSVQDDNTQTNVEGNDNEDVSNNSTNTFFNDTK